MKRLRFDCLLLTIILPALQACAPWSPVEHVGSREPVRWILVERRYGDVARRGDTGDGTINPEATVLALQPLYPEDLTWEVVVSPEEHFVELVNYSPAGPATPGEIVSATVRVGKAKSGQLYRLLAKPSHSDVRVLGDTQAVVKGEETTVFRFTNCTSGRAGIVIGVERIPALEAKIP